MPPKANALVSNSLINNIQTEGSDCLDGKSRVPKMAGIETQTLCSQQKQQRNGDSNSNSEMG